MPKYCIFCGKPPQAKNREHVLPRWLLEMTGDPNREVQLSISYDLERGLAKPLSFAFSHFTFRACETCNGTYGELEGKVRPIVERLLNSQPVTSSEVTLLLDWLDKVRVGLWLGQQQLTGNFFQVRPKFFIAERMGRADRAVLISRLAPSTALTVVGVQTPQFMYLPCVFGLRINDILLLNASTDFLLHERIGFPYPMLWEAVSGSKAMRVQLTSGKEVGEAPLIPMLYPLPAVRLHQPMFRPWVESPIFREAFDTEYVRERAIDWDGGMGMVIKETGAIQSRFSALTVSDYEHMSIYDNPSIKRDFCVAVLDWQNWMARFYPSEGNLTSEELKSRNLKIKWTTTTNTNLINQIRAGALDRVL